MRMDLVARLMAVYFFFLNLFCMDRVARFRAGIATSLFHDLLDDAAVFVGSHVDLAGEKNSNSQTSVTCTIAFTHSG
jgi:hypothetical protein